MATATTQAGPVRWWVGGDWNAFFGLFTNVVLNVLVLSGLVLGVIEVPGDVVYGRILPALGIALPLGNLYYAYLAMQLAKRAEQLVSERRVTRVEAMKYLLEVVVKGRAGEALPQFPRRSPPAT